MGMSQPGASQPGASQPGASQPGASQPCASQSGRAGKRRFQKGDRRQIKFREVCLDDLVPHDHPSRAIDAWAEARDLSDTLAQYEAVEDGPGRTPIHPVVLLRLWIFATLEGVGSARELSRLVERDFIYEWLAGGLPICHRVLSEFRVLDEQFLEDLLVQGVSDLMLAELVSMNIVAQDGMRVRASAGKLSFRRKRTLDEHEQQAREQLRALREELEHPVLTQDARTQARRVCVAEDRLERLQRAQVERDTLEAQRKKRGDKDHQHARASTTDPEARVMKMANGGFNPAFNVQFVTDVDTGVIVGADVVNQGTDAGQTVPAVEKIAGHYGKKPKVLTADGGYSTKDDINGLSAAGVAPCIPIKEYDKKVQQGQDPHAPSKGDSPAMKDWRAAMKTDEMKEKYKLRCQTAEWVNAQTRNHGLQQFNVRGLGNVKCVALLHAIAHNVQRGIALRHQTAELRAQPAK